jgi:hypothetical protein
MQHRSEDIETLREARGTVEEARTTLSESELSLRALLRELGDETIPPEGSPPTQR